MRRDELLAAIPKLCEAVVAPDVQRRLVMEAGGEMPKMLAIVDEVEMETFRRLGYEPTAAMAAVKNAGQQFAGDGEIMAALMNLVEREEKLLTMISMSVAQRNHAASLQAGTVPAPQSMSMSMSMPTRSPTMQMSMPASGGQGHSHDGKPCAGHGGHEGPAARGGHSHDSSALGGGHSHDSAPRGGHSHDGKPCGGHGGAASDHGHSHDGGYASGGHSHDSVPRGGHSHGGVPCGGHGGDGGHSHGAGGPGQGIPAGFQPPPGMQEVVMSLPQEMLQEMREIQMLVMTRGPQSLSPQQRDRIAEIQGKIVEGMVAKGYPVPSMLQPPPQ